MSNEQQIGDEQAEAVTAEEQDTPTNGTGEAEDIEAPLEAEPGLEEQLIETQKQAQEYQDGWQRARADFANYKKRTERELTERGENARLDMLAAFLPIIDDFDRALSNLPEELQEHAWLEGVGLIQRKFQKLLDDHDVSVIDPVGEEFDPNYHEAVGTDGDSDYESGHVTTTLQKGYCHGERVLRPALVRVAS